MPEQVQEFSPQELREQEPNKPLSARDFVLRYLKYVPWIIICGAIALVLAYVRLRYSVPIYRVQSSLLIGNDRANAAGGDQKLNELFLSQSNVNLLNEIEILKSRPLLERVARDLDLQKVYYNKGKLRSTLFYEQLPFRLQIMQLADSLTGFGMKVTIVNDDKFTLGESKTLYYFGLPFKLGANTCLLARDSTIRLDFLQSRIFLVNYQTVASAAGNILGSLRVAQPNEQATILSLSLETENIPMGKDILTMIMSVYDSLVIEDKTKISTNTLNFIEKSIDTVSGKLGAVEGQLRNFKERNEAYDLETQSRLYIDKIGETTKMASTQQVQMQVLTWLMDYLSNNKHINDIVPTDLGIAEPTLLQLISQYNALQLQRASNLKTTPATNPLIQGFDAALDKIRQNIIQALRNVRETYLIAGNKVAQEQSEAKGLIKMVPGKTQEALTISRKQKIYEELFSFLLQEKLKTSISSASTVSNSKVLEPALGSYAPVKPNRGSLYSTYLLIGLIIPIAIISIIELLSDKVNNRGEIERATSAPILGEIGHSEDRATLVVTRNSRRFIAEQFRIIRTNLQYVTGRNERPVILVTSSFSGEGKSFVSTNVGAVMALAGKKTVIMEFDIRKPKILSSLELKRKMGITNYLIGKAEFSELPIPVDEVENLYVIACGPIPPNPSELLLSSRLKELMREVKENFEVVIMDTAPVGLVSDAISLGIFADCTLYIVRRGHTVRRLMRLIQDLYSTQKLPSLSILLNDVKIEGGYYGGYYGGYGYYGYGYGHEGGYFEKEEPLKKRRSPIRKLFRIIKQLFS